ncbi:MAG: hypothetical protein ACTHQ3_13090, partial [Motilibacteraceae bacterium]
MNAPVPAEPGPWSAPPLPLAVPAPAPRAVAAVAVAAAGAAEPEPGAAAELERGARVVLARAAEPADVAVCGLVRRLGAPGALAALRSGRPVEGLRPARLAGLRLRLEGVREEAELARAAALGQR